MDRRASFVGRHIPRDRRIGRDDDDRPDAAGPQAEPLRLRLELHDRPGRRLELRRRLRVRLVQAAVRAGRADYVARVPREPTRPMREGRTTKRVT